MAFISIFDSGDCTVEVFISGASEFLQIMGKGDSEFFVSNRGGGPAFTIAVSMDGVVTLSSEESSVGFAAGVVVTALDTTFTGSRVVDPSYDTGVYDGGSAVAVYENSGNVGSTAVDESNAPYTSPVEFSQGGTPCTTIAISAGVAL